ncbi:MAG: serine hydrolase domain-containing protein [Caulobacteraceae bacterium]
MRPWLGAALAAAVCVLGGAALAQKPAAHPPAAAPPAPPAPAPAALPLQPGQPIPPAELEAFVDGFAAEAMARDHIAGAAVTVVQDGQVVLQKGYGADRLSPARPVDPDRTLFRLGEVTQLFTWIALAREIEAGHIRLDAPVNVYLPQKDQIRDQGYRQPIRVRNLMNHTAGFEDRSLGQLIERDPDRIRPLDVYLAQERPHRVREPGVLPTATGYGPALAGEALVQVTGRTLQSLVDGEIVQPLGLRRTTLREPYPARAGLPAPMDPALASDLSQGFQWTGGGFRALPTEFMTQAAPASAASASAADMGRFMLAILGDGTYGGATVYSPAIAREFRTPLDRPTPTGAAFDYGFMERPLPGGFAGYGHTGRTLGFHADLTVAPALGLGVFVAANTDTGRGLVAGLPAAVVQRFYAGPRALPPTPSPWLRENAGAFAGTYMTTARAYAGLERFADLLRDHSRVRVTGGGPAADHRRHGRAALDPRPRRLDRRAVRDLPPGGRAGGDHLRDARRPRRTLVRALGPLRLRALGPAAEPLAARRPGRRRGPRLDRRPGRPVPARPPRIPAELGPGPRRRGPALRLGALARQPGLLRGVGGGIDGPGGADLRLGLGRGC